MTNFLKYSCFILLGLMIQIQNNLAQKGFDNAPDRPEKASLFSELHTLSIHVRDTVTHDSVFHFLADKLKLPVYYYPVTFGTRKYAGLYAGNIVLEPCGPYSEYKYASNTFRAIFFGLTFLPAESLSITASGLTGREILFEATGNEYINITNSELCGENITIGFMERSGKTRDRIKLDSLRLMMSASIENELGIEYVKAISLGYKNSSNLKKLKDFFSSPDLKNNEVGLDPEFRFVKSNIREVQSITFKIRSLEKAKQYFLRNNLTWSIINKMVRLDKRQTFGLSVYVTEDE